MSWRSQISRCVNEIRLISCHRSASSKGLRDFIGKNYSELKMLNPSTPFMIRSGEGIDPFIYARYDWGVERHEYVTNMTEEQIWKKLEELVKYSDKLSKSPESDRILSAPIIDTGVDEEYFEELNLTWDGKTVRQHPGAHIYEHSTL